MGASSYESCLNSCRLKNRCARIADLGKRHAIAYAMASALLAAGCSSAKESKADATITPDLEEGSATVNQTPASAGASGASPSTRTAGVSTTKTASVTAGTSAGGAGSPQGTDNQPAADGGAEREQDESSGAAGAPDSAGGSETGMQVEPVCTGDEMTGFGWEPLEGLDPAESYDYLTWRTRVSTSPGIPIEVATQGTVCANASGSNCRTEVDLLIADESFPLTQTCQTYGPCQDFVITTRGDDIKRYLNREQIIEFLGDINTPQEALLVLYYDDFLIRCGFDPDDPKRTVVTPKEDGFDATVDRMVSDCPAQYARLSMHVSSAGVVQ